MKRNSRLIGRVLMTVLALGSAAMLAACGEDAANATDAPSTTDSGEPIGVVVPVVALDNSFRPQALEVHVGDTVSWENRGNNDHNVLSIEGEWGVEVTEFAPGAVYTHVFTEPGEYAYYCSIHGREQAGMVGTITVKP
jgi:plastocyanin